MTTRKITPGDLFALEFPLEIKVAPDDRCAAYTRQSADVQTDRWHTQLWLVDLETRRSERLTDGPQTVTTPRFDRAGKRLAYISDVGGSAQLYVLDLATRHATRLTALEGGAPNRLAWSHDGHWLAFYAPVAAAPLEFFDLPQPPAGACWAEAPYVTDMLPYKSDAQGYLPRAHTQLFIVAADGGVPIQLTTEPHQHGVSTFVTADPCWTLDDRKILISASRTEAASIDARNAELYSVAVADGHVKRFTEFDGVCYAPTLSPDDTRLAFLGFENAGMCHESLRLYLQDRSSGVVRELSADFDRDIAERLDNGGAPLIWAADGSGVYAMFDDRGSTNVGFFAVDGSMRTVANGIASGVNAYSFPNAFDVLKNGRCIAAWSTLDDPPELCVSRGGRVTALSRFNRGFKRQRAFGKPATIDYLDPQDGQTRCAWLLLPTDDPGKTGHRMVLEIHGGPHANFGNRFWARAQMFAARGYAVLLVNPAGSTSYGSAYAQAIQHDYPGRDVADLLAAVDAACGRGDIDANQLFVTGGSGGGVLTAALVAATNRFKAAACLYPVIDWTSFHLTTDIPTFIRWWFPALPWREAEHYAKRSLIKDIERVTAPTLVMCGDADQRTPFGQAEIFYQALKLNGVQSALVKFPGEAHGINRRPSHNAQAAALVMNWFDQHSAPAVRSSDGRSPGRRVGALPVDLPSA